ncbi:DUF3172 domain-containing protein [Tumidithrix helvetica PCC 7403]|uniref:DUF3172 domain-containing protein n=1 Tax=Tumidithrix elongata BACA0141 TaxID=2716417 RepID=A0AAW9PZ52_9CYAN|nr:DUF3172 domain-containing protein [Tumidithrix elongata RA019]
MARRRYSSTINPPTNTSSTTSTGIKLAIAGAIFAVGLGVGAALSTLNPTARTVDAIRLDNLAPSRDFCNNYGSSAMVMTTRVYVTLNPFNVFVSQADSVPGCVVLPQNWNLLLQQNAISNNDIQQCRNRMNTFGFTGDLTGKPRVDCVYESKDAQKQLTEGAPPIPKPTP